MQHRRSSVLAGMAVAASAVLVLSGCSGEDPAPTPPPTAAPTSGADPAPTASGGPEASPTPSPERTIDTSRWCEAGTLKDGDVTIDFGTPTAATGDEWTAKLGRTWRPYVPVTVTNELDVPCSFELNLRVSVDGAPAREDLRVPLEPGQSYRFQAFDLSEVVDIADTETAVADHEVKGSEKNSQRRPLIEDYYEMEATVGDIEGEGADAVLPVTVEVGDVRPGMPKHTGWSDYLMVVGLDETGDIVAKAFYETPAKVGFGERIDVKIPVAGGYASGDVRTQTPVSAYDDVVEYKVYLQPNQTEIDDLDSFRK